MAPYVVPEGYLHKNTHCRTTRVQVQGTVFVCTYCMDCGDPEIKVELQYKSQARQLDTGHAIPRTALPLGQFSSIQIAKLMSVLTSGLRNNFARWTMETGIAWVP
jgi:hypothetical protein